MLLITLFSNVEITSKCEYKTRFDIYRACSNLFNTYEIWIYILWKLS